MDVNIQKVIESEVFDAADKAALRWQYGMHGGFYTALWDVIRRADETNLMKLSFGFPDEVEGYKRWTRSDLYQRFHTQLTKMEEENGQNSGKGVE